MGQHKKNQHSGFTLIEILIGMAIGLILSLVIYNVLSTFEKQKHAINRQAKTCHLRIPLYII